MMTGGRVGVITVLTRCVWLATNARKRVREYSLAFAFADRTLHRSLSILLIL